MELESINTNLHILAVVQYWSFCDDLKAPQGKTVSKKKYWEKKKTEKEQAS